MIVLGICRGIFQQIGCHPCAACCDPFKSSKCFFEELSQVLSQVTYINKVKFNEPTKLTIPLAPITSEQVRRSSFPRSNNYATNYAVTTAAVQTSSVTTYGGQTNVVATTQPTYRPNEFYDPPPKYTDGLPSYESLGQTNKAYSGTLSPPASAPEL